MQRARGPKLNIEWQTHFSRPDTVRAYAVVGKHVIEAYGEGKPPHKKSRRWSLSQTSPPHKLLAVSVTFQEALDRCEELHGEAK